VVVRRLRFVVVVAGVLLCACVTALKAAHAQTPVIVDSGHWQGHAWRLEAGDDSGKHCYRITVDFPFTTAAPPHSPNCGVVLSRPPAASSNFPYGFGFNAFTVCPMAFVDGVTVSSASHVIVTLANGRTVRVSTVVPPPGLTRDVRYFAVQVPCGSRVTKLVGLDGSGIEVARVELRSG
jgi:hypothetical protein